MTDNQCKLKDFSQTYSVLYNDASMSFSWYSPCKPVYLTLTLYSFFLPVFPHRDEVNVSRRGHTDRQRSGRKETERNAETRAQGSSSSSQDIANLLSCYRDIWGDINKQTTIARKIISKIKEFGQHTDQAVWGFWGNFYTFKALFYAVASGD